LARGLEFVRGNLGDLFDAQPLALGAVGMVIGAVGAGIAASLPQTDLENSYLGETSETVRVTETAEEQVERLRLRRM
jgi:hypothetical protein